MIGFVVLGVLTTLLGLAVLANSRWAARRGWVYNKHNPRPSGRGIPTSLGQFFQPSIEHMIEERASESVRADQNEAGEDPGPG